MRYIELTMTVEEEDGQFVSLCQELGTASCGDTPEEALANLREAVTIHIAGLEEVGTKERVFQERGIVIHDEEDAPESTRYVGKARLPVGIR